MPFDVSLNVSNIQDVPVQAQPRSTKRIVLIALAAIALTAVASAIIVYAFNIPIVQVLGGALTSLTLLFLKIFGSKKQNQTPTKTDNQILEEQFINENKKEIDTLVEKLNNQPKDKENRLYTNETLDSILNLVDRSRQASKKTEQIEKLKMELANVLGEEKAKLAFEIPELIPSSVILDSKKILTQKGIDYLVKKASNYFHNKDAILRMNQIIAKESGNTEIVNEILSQLDLTEYLKGQKKLSEEFENEILKAIRHAIARNNFDNILSSIKESANKDLVLDDNFIDQKFCITQTIQPLSKEEQERRRITLQKIINQAYVTQELKYKGKFACGSFMEHKLLKYLGYTLDENSSYYNKEAVYDILNQVVQSQLQIEGFTGSLATVRNSLKECALRARLETLGIKGQEVEKFKEALVILNEIKGDLKEKSKQIKLVLPADFPLKHPSPAIEYLEGQFESEKKFILSDTIAEYFHSKKFREIFKDNNISTENFVKRMKKRQEKMDVNKFITQCENINNDEDIKSEIAFFMKWGKYIKVEMIQGLNDDNEVLDKGVCWGLSNQIQMLAQKNPNLSADQMAKHIRINRKHRFFQSLHAANKTITKRFMPETVLKKEGFTKETVLFELTYDSDENDFEKIITAKDQSLKLSNGSLRLQFLMNKGGGHAIYGRFDSARNVVWIFDPNVGFLTFESSEKDFNSTRNLGFAFFKDLMKHRYPDAYTLNAHQIV